MTMKDPQYINFVKYISIMKVIIANIYQVLLMGETCVFALSMKSEAFIEDLENPMT